MMLVQRRCLQFERVTCIMIILSSPYSTPSPLYQHLWLCLIPLMMLFQLQGFQTASIIPKWGLQSKRGHLQHYHSVHLPLFLALYSTPSPPMPAGVCKHPLWSRELAANTTCWCCSDEFRVLHNLIRQTINFAEMSFGDEKLWLYGPRRRKGWGPRGGGGWRFYTVGQVVVITFIPQNTAIGQRDFFRSQKSHFWCALLYTILALFGLSNTL